MRYTLSTALAAGALLTAVTAGAQDHHGKVEEAMPPPSAPAAPTASAVDRETAMASWPEDQRAAYASWPENIKQYYWSLNEQRQTIFWTLPDSDKVALATIPAPDAEAAWQKAERKPMPDTHENQPLDPQPQN